jgi:thioredoxin reductase
VSQPLDPDAAARDSLRLIGPDPQNWVPDRAGIDHNVTIVGGGQTGSALSFALRRAGIGKVSVIDAAEDAAQAGIWLTSARMNLLRTPKSLPGPELGIPGFGFQSWYEARYGAAAYAAIDRIPRTDWAEYLAWYREFLGIAIRYRTKLLRIEPADGHFRLHLDAGGGTRVETTRKIILCAGFAGNGGPYIPAEIRDGLPTTSYAHTEDAIDFASLRGKQIAVIGAAASAFDAAGASLEAGAASVRLFARRTTVASVPITRSRGYPGAYDNFHALPDAIRWEQAQVSPMGVDPDHRCHRAGCGVPAFPSAPRGSHTIAADRGRTHRRTRSGSGLPLRFRHSGNRLSRRPRGMPRAGRLPPPDVAMARQVHTQERR